MRQALDFVKVHAGWDECIFIHGDQVPPERRIAASLSLLRKPSIRGIEVGILFPPEGSGDVRIKMVDDTSQRFIRMCGGLTQSLGKAIAETSIGKKLGIDINEGKNRVVLETDAGLIPIEIEIKTGTVQKVSTDMSSYVTDCYERGVELVEVEGMTLVNAGINEDEREFLVLDVNEVGKRFPQINFWSRDPATFDALEHIYRAFLALRNIPLDFLYGVLYESSDNLSGKTIRTVFRFFPWDYPPGDQLDYGCGTGTIALGIALYEQGRIQLSDGPKNLLLTVGGENLPEKTRVKTQLTLEGTKSRIQNAWFSHNLIELVASGKVYVAL
jgi:hypothetical protein